MKPGEVAVHRITGEEVFVVALREEGPVEGLSGTRVDVRRPVVTQNGIIHRDEVFFVEELESRDAREAREDKERDTLAKKIASIQQRAQIEDTLSPQAVN